VGNFGTSHFEHEDRLGNLVEGLRGEYFPNLTLSGAAVIDRVDQRINFDWLSHDDVHNALPAQFTVRWTGLIRASSSSLHVFPSEKRISGIRVFLDEKPIIDDWREHAAASRHNHEIPGKRNRTYRLRIEYKNTGGGGAIAQFRLGFAQGPRRKFATTMAAIVCVGFDNGNEGEGFRSHF